MPSVRQCRLAGEYVPPGEGDHLLALELRVDHLETEDVRLLRVLPQLFGTKFQDVGRERSRKEDPVRLERRVGRILDHCCSVHVGLSGREHLEHHNPCMWCGLPECLCWLAVGIARLWALDCGYGRIIYSQCSPRCPLTSKWSPLVRPHLHTG